MYPIKSFIQWIKIGTLYKILLSFLLIIWLFTTIFFSTPQVKTIKVTVYENIVVE